jgi:hypothetical protein
MISYLAAIPAGNAVQLLFAPAQAATEWLLLRNTTGEFPVYNDPNSALLYRGSTERSLLDVRALINGTVYYYCLFELIAGTWYPTPVQSATPAAAYGDASNDVMLVLRERLELGLANEVALKRLQSAYGRVPVLTAPPVFEDTKFPIVTVHLASEMPAERAVGEVIDPDCFNPDDGVWTSSEGWLASVSINVVGWALNADVRLMLRMALRRIVTANLPVFDSFGFVLVQTQQSDMEDFESYAAPVYQTLLSFSCVAPVRVTSQSTAVITDFEVTANPE